MSESGAAEIATNAPPTPDDAPESAAILLFMSKLGIAMMAAGQSITAIQASLATIATAYQVQAQITVLPNTLLIKIGVRGESEVDLASELIHSLRLDQAADVFKLVAKAERAEIAPLEGVQCLQEIEGNPSRYSAAVRILGYAAIAVGIGLILEGSFSQLLTCVLLGILIGELKELCGKNRTAETFVPVLASMTVGIIVFSIVKADVVSGPLMLLIPPVVTFLPGAALTMALLELANGDVISGSSQLVAGGVKLLLLVFGYIVAAELVGLPTAEAFAQEPRPLFGWWAAWLGVLVYGIGTYVHHTAPKRALPWLLIVLYVAFAGQQLGGQMLGSYLSGFVGAVLMTPVAYWIQRRPGAPPAIVTFLPGFWLLVPGSLGLIGLTQLAGNYQQAGLQTVGDMTLALVAVALGVMVGIALVQPIGKPIGQLPASTERAIGKVVGKSMVALDNIQEAARRERDKSVREESERSRQADNE